MSEEKDKIDQVLNKLDQALKAVAQGRIYDVGVKVLYQGKFGIIVDLNKDASDPAGSTVDVRLEDGKVIEGVKVSSSQLKRYRA